MNGSMEITLLGKPYTLSRGEHVLNYLGLLTDTVNRVARDVIAHGQDIHEGAMRQQATAEWLRQKMGNGSGAVGFGSQGGLAALGLLGLNTQTAQPAPAPAQPVPQTPSNPHKTGVPTIGNKNALIINNNGSIEPATAHTMSDLAMQILITNGTVFFPANNVICHVTFATPFTVRPNVLVTQLGPPTVGSVFPVNVTTTGFDLGSGQSFLAADVLAVHINVFPTAGDPTY